MIAAGSVRSRLLKSLVPAFAGLVLGGCYMMQSKPSEQDDSIARLVFVITRRMGSSDTVAVLTPSPAGQDAGYAWCSDGTPPAAAPPALRSAGAAVQKSFKMNRDGSMSSVSSSEGLDAPVVARVVKNDGGRLLIAIDEHGKKGLSVEARGDQFGNLTVAGTCNEWGR